MPFGPGTYGNGTGEALASPALAKQGIPESVLPATAPDSQALSEIVQMLRGGQAGSERLLQLLALVTQSTIPQMDKQPQQPQMGGPGDIAALLGG